MILPYDVVVSLGGIQREEAGDPLPVPFILVLENQTFILCQEPGGLQAGWLLTGPAR